MFAFQRGRPAQHGCGKSPLDHMDTVTGVEEIKTMLYHIEHGMPA